MTTCTQYVKFLRKLVGELNLKFSLQTVAFLMWQLFYISFERDIETFCIKFNTIHKKDTPTKLFNGKVNLKWKRGKRNHFFCIKWSEEIENKFNKINTIYHILSVHFEHWILKNWQHTNPNYVLLWHCPYMTSRP
jgi:hypothetical protein